MCKPHISDFKNISETKTALLRSWNLHTFHLTWTTVPYNVLYIHECMLFRKSSSGKITSCHSFYDSIILSPTLKISLDQSTNMFKWMEKLYFLQDQRWLHPADHGNYWPSDCYWLPWSWAVNNTYSWTSTDVLAKCSRIEPPLGQGSDPDPLSQQRPVDTRRQHACTQCPAELI